MIENGKIKAILCMNVDGCIGKGNDLLYRLKNDLKRFKELTNGSIVVMGRNTANSLPKPLPNRINVVVSKTPYVRDGFEWCQSFEELLLGWLRKDDIWIIGGAKFFESIKNVVEEWYVTIVYDESVGDVYLKGGLAFFTGMRGIPEQIHIEDEYTYEFVKFIQK